MPEIEEEVIGSHTEETLQDEQNEIPMSDVYAAFGIEAPKKEETKAEEDAPAIEQKPEPRMLKVKHNKEEIEVDVSDDKLPEYVQKSLALDKERERREKNDHLLKEAAKLLGLETLDETTIQRLSQVQQQQEQDKYSQLRVDLREQAEALGYDPDSMQAYLDNHPLVKQAQSAIQERDAVLAEKHAESFQKGVLSAWDDLFKQHPDIERREVFFEGNQAFFSGEGSPEWLTPEMVQRLERGYSVNDAFDLSHRDKITAQTKKATEQRMIKEQQLGLRSRVETTTAPDNEQQVPAALAAAFAAFDLPASAAKKYVKK